MKFSKVLKKSIPVLLPIDFIFITVLYFFIFFIIRKLKEYALLLQNITPALQGLEQAIAENISQVDLIYLNTALESVQTIAQRMLYLGILLFVGSYLIYCIFQSIQWNLDYNLIKGKLRLKNFKKYLLKFCILNLVPYILFLVLSFFTVLNLKSLFTGIWFNNLTLSKILAPVFLIILALIVLYLTFMCCVFINKYSVLISIKKAFKLIFKKYNLFLALLALFASICLLIILYLAFGFTSLIIAIVNLTLILFLINLFRIFVVKDLHRI